MQYDRMVNVLVNVVRICGRHVTAIISLYLSLHTGFVMGQSSSPTEHLWKLYGKGFDFESDNALRGALLSIGPHLDSDRVSLRKLKLHPDLIAWSRKSLQTIWFKRSWSPSDSEAAAVEIAPDLSGEDFDKSCLYYRWTRNGTKLEVCESSAGLIVRVATSAFDFREGVPREKIANFLNEVLKLGESAEMDSVATLFDVPQFVKNGSVFGSLKDDDGPISFFTEWRYAVKLFVADDKLNLVLFRSNRDVGFKGPFGEKRKHLGVPATVGVFYNPQWLDRAVFREDGKTSVAMEELIEMRSAKR